ncbi:MAG TPA: hypothetical protein VFC63_12995 [Blastocatellia bacterium]|nr:hypothetical protein [Blastocatellia bacterium]
MVNTHSPVVIFGAGATAACGGPITNQILPDAFRDLSGTNPPHSYQREGFFYTVEQFLLDNFHIPASQAAREARHYPGLPLLLSLVDTAIDRGQPFCGRNLDDLRNLRASIEYLIFAVLQERLKSVPENNPYTELLQEISVRYGIEPIVISLNYDLIADNVLFMMALTSRNEDTQNNSKRKSGRLPNYGCDIRTEAYQSRLHDYGLLLKPHGSLNWLYCPNCHRLDIGLAEEGPGQMYTRKVLNDLYQEINLHEKYSCQGAGCNDCGSPVRPVLITPTHKKDYRNPHIAQVWYQAERVLRKADRVFIIGYSLPDDDVEVIYLLKRGLSHLTNSAERITVVQREDNKGVIQRYRSLFGERFDWQKGGFQEWLSRFKGRKPRRPLTRKSRSTA